MTIAAQLLSKYKSRFSNCVCMCQITRRSSCFIEFTHSLSHSRSKTTRPIKVARFFNKTAVVQWFVRVSGTRGNSTATTQFSQSLSCFNCAAGGTTLFDFDYLTSLAPLSLSRLLAHSLINSCALVHTWLLYYALILFNLHLEFAYSWSWFGLNFKIVIASYSIYTHTDALSCCHCKLNVTFIITKPIKILIRHGSHPFFHITFK